MTYFTPPALAERWGCTPETVLTLIKTGRLSAFNLSPPGRKRPRWKITETAVEQFENPKIDPTAAPKRTTRKGADDTPDYY